MDLWIRTQNGTTLTKVATIALRETVSAKDFKQTCEIVGFAYDDGVLPLGRYKSTIRCLEILTHIQAILNHTEKTVYVYEMPKE